MSSIRTAASRNSPTQAVFIELPAIFEAWFAGTPVKSSTGAPDNRACSGATGKSCDDKSSRGAKNRFWSWKHGIPAEIILKLFPKYKIFQTWIEQWCMVSFALRIQSSIENTTQHTQLHFKTDSLTSSTDFLLCWGLRDINTSPYWERSGNLIFLVSLRYSAKLSSWQVFKI